MLEDGIRRWNPWWAEKETIVALSGVERDILLEIMKTINLSHIKDILGVRRSGKTTILYQITKLLLNKKINPRDIVFLNFDDSEINASSFDDVLKSLSKINPNIKYLFIDEIQQKSGWERWIRTLYDTKMFKQIFVSGSSASLLSQDMGRVLTGRHVTFSVFPFSFREYLKFIEWENFDINFLKYNKNKLLHHQEKYIKNGGFPETIDKTDSEIKIILTSIYNDILSRDISSRFGASYDITKKISYHLLSNISKDFSYRSIANSTGLSVETVEKYLGFLKESFMILTLDFFSYKTKIQFKQNKKAYCIDTGLRNAVSFKFSEDIGRLTENVVFIELKRRNKDVYYWKDKSGREVDFIVKDGLKIKKLIQVCWNVEDIKTREREVKSLLEAMKEFKLKQGLIITEDYENEKKIEGKKIKFIPLWKWLLLE
jgi:hypothetical protein